MSDRDKPEDKPTHSIESDDRQRDEPRRHEVDPPKERVDDEVGSDEAKRTQRQE